MGYYTRFYFEVRTPVARECAERIANRLNEIMGCENCFTLPDSEDTTVPNWSLEPYDEMKWYDWEDHMSQLANEFPYVEFRLEGNGEDRDDWWVALFKGERNQVKYCSPPTDEWED